MTWAKKLPTYVKNNDEDFFLEFVQMHNLSSFQMPCELLP